MEENNQNIIEHFLQRHTSTSPEGRKQINVVTALAELDARLKSKDIQIQELQDAVRGASTMYNELLERVNKLSPNITIYGPNDADNLLNGNNTTII